MPGSPNSVFEVNRFGLRGGHGSRASSSWRSSMGETVTVATTAHAYAPPVPDGSRSRWWVVGAMSAASIVLTIDLFGVNVALPTIARELDLSTTELQWVPSIYFLALAAPLVAAGRIGDVFG